MKVRAAFRKCLQLTLCAAAVASMLQQSAIAMSGVAITGWDFEDGTLQGWSNPLTPPTTGPTSYQALLNPAGTWDPQQGSYFAFVDPFANRDSAHDQPLVLRSPAFSLVPGENISFHLLGGDGGGTAGASAVIPVNDSSIVTNSSDAAGFLGVALRRNSDGAYLLTKNRTTNRIDFPGWEEFRFSSTELAGVIASNSGETFTLDVIDTAHGSFGGIALDTVTIPIISNQSIVAGGGLWNVEQRVSSASRLMSLAEADALLALPSNDPLILAEFSGTAAVINFHDLASNGGRFGNDAPFMGGGGVVFAGRATGIIDVIDAGDITFGFSVNDGGRLTIDGMVVAQRSSLGYGTQTGSINLSAGPHEVEFMYYQDLGGATAELFIATTSGPITTINQSSYQLLVASAIPEPSVCCLLLPLFGFRIRRCRTV